MNKAIEQHCFEKAAAEGEELTSAGIDQVRREMEREQKRKEFLAKRGSRQAGKNV